VQGANPRRAASAALCVPKRAPLRDCAAGSACYERPQVPLRRASTSLMLPEARAGGGVRQRVRSAALRAGLMRTRNGLGLSGATFVGPLRRQCCAPRRERAAIAYPITRPRDGGSNASGSGGCEWQRLGKCGAQMGCQAPCARLRQRRAARRAAPTPPGRVRAACRGPRRPFTGSTGPWAQFGKHIPYAFH
jgi:hypothetical protein